MVDIPEPISPLYAGEPVIVTHLAVAEGANITACTGEPFVPARDRPNIPRVLCPGCSMAARHGYSSSLTRTVIKET